MAKDSLSALADAVASDRAIDWLDAESSAVDASELEAIRQLRALASLGAVSKSLTPRWGPFELRGEIGRGAFGTVYRAWDPRLGREVALKLLNARAHPAYSGGLIAEARLLASVDHPNIVPVYGADVHDGRVGIWMKLVNGKTLKEILVEQGPFGAEEAAQIGRVLCRALAAVHRKGFVHRDVKAQNVMRAVGGEILLMDFGAGDVIAEARSGSLRGSPAYLAPEVLDGGPPTVQSDVYSMGVLLFHLVTGSFPVEGASFEDLRRKHGGFGRRRLAFFRPDIDPAFAATVESMLEGDVRARPVAVEIDEALAASATGLTARRKTRLRSTAWVSALALTAAIGILIPRLLPESAADSLAVLPIKNLTGSGAYDYLASGFTEALTATIAELPGLKVPSTIATSTLRDADRPSAELGRQLGVRFLLAGAVTEVGDRVRLSVQLIDAQSGLAIWGEELVRTPASVLSARTEIAAAISARLKLKQPHVRTPLEVPSAAQEAYLRGLVAVNQQKSATVDLAVAQFRLAVEHAPEFAAAWAELALAELRGIELGDWTTRSKQAEFAREHALTAIRLDPREANGYVALASVQYNHDWDFEAADATFRKALEIAPNHSFARMRYAYLLAGRGKVSEAIAQAVAARDLEPLVPVRSTAVGIFRYYARDFDGALRDMLRALELSPGFIAGHYGAGRVLVTLGRPREAARHIQSAVDTSPNPAYLAGLAYAHIMAGDLAAAERALMALRAEEVDGHHASIDNLAYVAIARGQTEEAFELLEEAVRRRMTNVLWLAVDPRVDPLRTDRRFDELLQTLNLPVSQ